MSTNRICVVGAGRSGIAAAKVLQDRGLGFDCFEEADGPGGVWAIDSSTGRSSAYRRLHTNTSKPRTAYPGFPHFPDVADYQHHQMLPYLQRYIDYNGLRERLTTDSAVVRATPIEGGAWNWPPASTGSTRVWLWPPAIYGQRVWPTAELDGFDGDVVHSRDQLDPQPYSGRRVVVVGLGNTAADVAVDLSGVVAKTYLSARSGSWWVPKYLFGRPVDQLVSSTTRGFAVLLKRSIARPSATVSRIQGIGPNQCQRNQHTRKAYSDINNSAGAKLFLLADSGRVSRTLRRGTASISSLGDKTFRHHNNAILSGVARDLVAGGDHRRHSRRQPPLKPRCGVLRCIGDVGAGSQRCVSHRDHPAVR